MNVVHTMFSALDGVIRHRHRHRMPVLCLFAKSFPTFISMCKWHARASTIRRLCARCVMESDCVPNYAIRSIFFFFFVRPYSMVLSRLLLFRFDHGHTHTRTAHTLYPEIRTDWRHHSRCADFLHHLNQRYKSASILVRCQCVRPIRANAFILFMIYFPLSLRIK